MSYINSVTVSPSQATVTKGKWYYGAYASIASDCPECDDVRWYSNNSSIASVNATTGYIYGVSTGTTRIYAEATDGSGKKDYITVTVTAPISVTGVEVCPTSLTMNVGDTDYVYKTVSPSNATNQTVTWCSSNESVATVNTYTGFVRAKKAGIVTIAACTVDGGFTASCTVTVNPLLIYQTRNTEVKWFDPEVKNASESIRPDLHYNHMTKLEIANDVSNIDTYDFQKYIITHHDGSGEYYPRTISDYKNSFMSMSKTYFANNQFDPIIEDMIEHFMGEKDVNFDGTIENYDVYKNPELTQQVSSHTESIKYANHIKDTLDGCLKDNSGNISALKYDPLIRFIPKKREELPFVAKALLMGYKQPVFDSSSDATDGFTICLDSLQGNKVEILSYVLNGNTYSGTMKITYYDHFGLDIKDMTGNYGFKSLVINTLSGFKDWFILQHCNELGVTKHPKPFVTMIEIEIPFSGRI